MTTVKSPVAVTPEQMKNAELRSEADGVSLSQLMDNVGKGIACGLDELVGLNGRNVTILCGSGNNGGDGYAASRYIAKYGAKATVVSVKAPSTELAIQASERALPYIFREIPLSNREEAFSALNAQIILDCVYGTGFHGELSEDIAGLFSACNISKAFKASADIASGCNALNGTACENAFRADVTFAAGAVKTGQLIPLCAMLSGRIIPIEIGITAYPGYEAEINSDSLLSLFPKRERFTHKGSYGRLLNVAGSERFPGAAWLSCHAAMRTGAGIVTLASVKEVTSSVSMSLHECTFLPLKNGMGYIDAEDISDILAAAGSSDAVIIGCGMGNREDTRLAVTALAENISCPVLVDADGINSLSGHIHELRDNINGLLMTPHPKEFSRISGYSVEEILSDPINKAKDFSKEYGVFLLLKGAYSVIATPDGRTAVNMSGNEALAKGGSGDCLTGTIGGLLAQGVEKFDALRLGAYLAGLAAEKAAETRAMSGIMPGELAELYPYILKS